LRPEEKETEIWGPALVGVFVQIPRKPEKFDEVKNEGGENEGKRTGRAGSEKAMVFRTRTNGQKKLAEEKRQKKHKSKTS